MAEGDKIVPESSVVATAGRRRRLRTFLGKLMLLGIALVAAGAVAEAMVRLARPGFPGFRLPQIEHEPVQGLGFAMVPNQTGYTVSSKVTINSAGFRGPEIRTPRQGLRVFSLGDSITFGVGVDDDVPYPRQLEALLKSEWPQLEPEVINGGVQRYFTYQEVEQLKRYGPDLKPDIVTLAVYPNDLGERPEGDFTREYENEREQAATSFRRRMPYLYVAAKNSAALELAKLVYLSRGERENVIAHAYRGVATPRDERRWKGFERELESFAAETTNAGYERVVIVIPAARQVIDDLPGSLYPNRVLEMCERFGLRAVSVLERFKASHRAGADPYLPWDGHLSHTGHRIVAEAARDEILRIRTSAASAHQATPR